MSGNPNPQHNPTDGLGVAAYVHVSGTNVGPAGVIPGTSNGFPQGQGVGASSGTPTGAPVAQYALTLSLGAKTYAGVSYHATCQLTPALVDVKNNSYSPVGSETYISYNNPSTDGDGDAPAWYNPNPFGSYNADVASVSSSGLITALNVGQAIIEVQFPTFDNTLSSPAAGGAYPGDVPSLGSNADGGTPVQFNPNEMVYAQIIVTVLL